MTLYELGGREVDYQLLNGPLAAEYDPHRYPKINYTCIPRFVKTHMEYSRRRFGRNRTLYVIRNLGDTMVSYYEYLKARRDRLRFNGTFGQFIRHRQFGIEAWARHVAGWLPEADATISYEDMKADGVKTILDALQRLGVDRVAEAVISEAVQRSSFERVRNMEERRGLDRRAREHLEEGFRFARKGAVGQWQDYFAEDDLVLVDQILAQFGLTRYALSRGQERNTSSGLA